MTKGSRAAAACIALLLSAFSACAGEPAESNADKGPYDELKTLGLDQYIGADEAVVEAQEASVTTWTWKHDPKGNSPGCFRGGAYRMTTRDAGSENLVVFLQGGGACWSDVCLAFSKAGKRIPNLDMLNPKFAGNPVVNWNVAYFPYCDASLFAGDARYFKANGEIDRDHRGLRNLSAGLTATKQQFPNAKRILLAGSSGGGFGTILGLPLVRMQWPDAEIILMNDAGIGLGKPADAAFMTKVLDEFNVTRFLPPSCADCKGSEHLTNVVRWGLEQDTTVRAGAFTSTRDFVISTLFLQIDGEIFEKAARAEIKSLEDRLPGRFAGFITDGTKHTTLLGDPSGFATSEGDPSASNTLKSLSSFLGGMGETKTGDTAFLPWFIALVEGGEGFKPVAP